jgi:branched-chain amino acid transport system substrate-binding protein
MFEATGRDLSRQSFLATLTSGVEFNTNLFPTVKFSPTSRFGATTSHVLEADCQARRYKTVGTFIAAY